MYSCWQSFVMASDTCSPATLLLIMIPNQLNREMKAAITVENDHAKLMYVLYVQFVIAYYIIISF